MLIYRININNVTIIVQTHIHIKPTLQNNVNLNINPNIVTFPIRFTLTALFNLQISFNIHKQLDIIRTVKKTQNMDMHDFEGLTKYKLIIPAIYIINWLGMIFGPLFFPVVYQKISITFIAYLTCRIFYMLITMSMVFYKSMRSFNRAIQKCNGKNQYGSLNHVGEQIYYAFIIPNYKEEVQLIGETLNVLAQHVRAKNQYMIFLAMEAHQQNSQIKAYKIIQQYKHRFRAIDFTRHQIRPNEQKGKAANVSWCAQKLQLMFQKYMINPDTVMVTIIDADSWVPSQYIDELQQMICNQYCDRHLRLYQPTQIFTRNNLQVPVWTRVYDILHSYAHMSNLWSCVDLTYALSNYTLSYNLIKRVGFWDTCEDAIGQDFHMTLKTYWKTKMLAQSRPIYVPFNQVNIQTGNGYCADVKARFWQAQRHAKGVSDVAYCFKMFLNQDFKWKNLFVWWFVFETFAVSATLPWILISINYQSKILYRYYKASPQLLSQDSVSYILTAMSIFGTIGYLLYQIVKRRANKIIYKQQNQSIFRILQYSILFIVVFFLMNVPSFVIASFRALAGNQEYVVAQKKNTSPRKDQVR